MARHRVTPMLCLFIRGDKVKIINIDVIKQTYDVSPVEGDVNVIKVKFINTPSEWLDNGYGVYALFTKEKDSEIMSVDKNTWECEIPNRMVAVNSGVKVILYAMNSDTTNPKRWVIDPVWVAISEGLDNSYEVTATSGLSKDNMDAISTLIQTISKYPAEEQKRVEAEKKRAEAELLREGMVKDLGSYDNIDNYNQAIDGAKTSGLYKIQYTDDVKTVPCVFLVISGVDFAGKELVYQMLMRGAYLNENETSIPLMRVYTDGAWSDSIYQFESSYYKNSNIINNANSEEMYPTNKGVSDYVFSEVNKVIGGAPDAFNTLGKIATAIGNHVYNYNNPHQVTKKQLGLDNVNNTSDEDKPLSDAAKNALAEKLDKSAVRNPESVEGDPLEEVPSVAYMLDYVTEKCKDNIVDLGTYKVEVDPDTGNMIIDESSQFRNAVNEAKQTGIYKITHTEAGAKMPFILVVLGSVDLRGKDLVTQYCFGDNPFLPADYNVPSLPRIRKYYYSNEKNAYVWTDDEYFNSESIFQTTTNLVHDDTNFNENYEFKYPSVGSMVRYIDRKLQPEQPITTLPDILESNKEYIIGGFLDSVFISFPSIANKGDVIYITFYAENVDGLPNLVIDTTNTSDIELIPEPSAGYEIFAKYNGEIWIVDYSEYSLGW